MISARAYSDLKKNYRDQTVVISGESGAGKTEAVKRIIDHLSMISEDGLNDVVEKVWMSIGWFITQLKNLFHSQIIDANCVLEVLGNAKTCKNDNSSRYGKQISHSNKLH